MKGQQVELERESQEGHPKSRHLKVANNEDGIHVKKALIKQATKPTRPQQGDMSSSKAAWKVAKVLDCLAKERTCDGTN